MSKSEVASTMIETAFVGEKLVTSRPVRPSWDRFMPGGYNKNRQLKLTGKRLTLCCETFAGIAILFFGYDQGVLAGVNGVENYKMLMGVNSSPQSALHAATIGGIVAVYYLGTFIGAVIAGELGDRVGRLKTIFASSLIAIVGAVLQSSAMNITWMCFGRVITGLGTGGLNTIVPVWTAELSAAEGRGAALGFEFFLNICGLALAYWIEFSLRGVDESLRWRLPLAIQIVFLIMLLGSISFFPESPRWLARMGEDEEALAILARLRTEDADETDKRVREELEQVMEVVTLDRQNPGGNNYLVMMTNADRYKMGRRVGLVVSLQLMQQLVGIAVITVYAPTVFQQAGYSEYLASLLSGINNLTYAASVWVAVFTLDRMGRRITLYWGAVAMGASLMICGVAGRFVAQVGISDAERLAWGRVLTAFVFAYTATFGATWLTVPWIYPTEIMPLHVRAKGGAFSTAGWSIGNGVVVLLTPYLFNSITYGVFFLFSMLNFACIPVVWAFYPETAGRPLESMDELFEGSVFVRKAEKQLRLRKSHQAGVNSA